MLPLITPDLSIENRARLANLDTIVSDLLAHAKSSEQRIKLLESRIKVALYTLQENCEANRATFKTLRTLGDAIVTGEPDVDAIQEGLRRLTL